MYMLSGPMQCSAAYVNDSYGNYVIQGSTVGIPGILENKWWCTKVLMNSSKGEPREKILYSPNEWPLPSWWVPKKKKAAGLTLVCPSVTVRGTLVEGHLFLGGKGLSQFHKTTIWTGKSKRQQLVTYVFNFLFIYFLKKIFIHEYLWNKFVICYFTGKT